MNLRTIAVSSIGQFIDAVSSISDEWKKSPYTEDSDIWFRGVRNNQHKLLPGAYRRDFDHNSLFNEFFSKSYSLINPHPQNELEWYFAAQHYGIPTRLLDWSDSPMVALYFAIRDCEIGKTPCVWALNASALNEISVGDPSVIVPRESGDGFVLHWSPQSVVDGRSEPSPFDYNSESYTNKLPIAILPPRATPRIIAQRGTFTLHGTEAISIEDIFAAADTPLTDGITRIDIHDSLANLKILEMLGYDEFYVFPEAASLAQALNKRYGAP